MLKWFILSFLLTALIFTQGAPSPQAFAVNPRTFILKERMKKAEESLQKPEAAQGQARLKYLNQHLTQARQNIESLDQELSRLNGETEQMSRLTTLGQVIAHEKKMEKVHQMVRSQTLLLHAMEGSRT